MGIACQHHANLLLQMHLKRSSTRGCTMASSPLQCGPWLYATPYHQAGPFSMHNSLVSMVAQTLCSFLLMAPNLPSRHTWTASSVLVVPYTTRNATHLLQRALKAELGEHVTQTGLQVTSNRLRFDFAHIGALTVEEMGSVEARVNKYAAAELVVTTIEKKPSEAVPCASFGDKYGDIVRIVRVGYDDVAEDATAGVSVSSKFCGGTYVHNAREVFPFVFSQ
ncbi:unnamed protein product [Peronospora farinosa]|uniref:alanine--tRNA ligase n=1 Tax=Peronospora farinosa TaxID=134698 RepID=A0AAV0UG45_9STRA|nr:unnamed protein product [Peronospora farinosa]